jgi:hypothetical protein
MALLIFCRKIWSLEWWRLRILCTCLSVFAPKGRTPVRCRYQPRRAFARSLRAFLLNVKIDGAIVGEVKDNGKEQEDE